jgi:hypothetical protein
MPPGKPSRIPFIVLGLAGLAVVAILAHFLWWQARPSEDARYLLARHAQRATVPEADNAYVYLQGIRAPDGVEPVGLGRKRIAWLLSQQAAGEFDAPDPQPRPEDDRAKRSPSMQAFYDACGRRSAATLCTAMFGRRVADLAPTRDEQRLLARYQALVAFPTFFEVVPYDERAPFIPFDEALNGQRLNFIMLARAAERGDVAPVRDGLARDTAFWRTVQRNADTLIPKMIAIAALRNTFFFGNRILRRLPADRLGAAIPAEWLRPFDAEELSMTRSLAGEFEYATRYIQRVSAESRVSRPISEDGEDPEHPEFVERVAPMVLRGIGIWQRQLNGIARTYRAVGEEFQVPLHEYEAAAKRVEARGVRLGHMDARKYVLRVATVEGQRRAALLISQIRARGIPREKVGAAVSESGLLDPFTRRAFTWNAEEGTLTFEGPAENGPWRRQAYLY